MPDPADLEFWASPGPLTNLARHAGQLEKLPNTLPELCRFVQGLVVHAQWAQAYGLEPETLRQDDLQTRDAADLIDRVLAVDSAPLTEARPPAKRFVGNCRHFSTLMSALLRHQGVPARARCGFGAYFEPDKLVDHWVCEVWDSERAAFRLVDAQLDELQCKILKLPFDPGDLPRDAFRVAGAAWSDCRAGRVDPQTCGIFDMWGLWFVQGNVVRDVAALNRVELLPWDDWGLMGQPIEGDVAARLDRASERTREPDTPLAELRALYADAGFRVPHTIQSFTGPKPVPVELDLEA